MRLRLKRSWLEKMLGLRLQQAIPFVTRVDERDGEVALR